MDGNLLSLMDFMKWYIWVAWHTLSSSILCFLFFPVVCGVLHGLLWEHDGAMSMTPKVSLQEHDGSISTTPLDLRWELGWDCREIHMHKFFTRLLLFNKYVVWHTNTHTDTACIQHVNLGSLRNILWNWLVGEGLLPECSVGDLQQRQLKLKHAWQLTFGLCIWIINGRLLTGSTSLATYTMDAWSWQWLSRSLHIETTLINAMKFISWF